MKDTQWMGVVAVLFFLLVLFVKSLQGATTTSGAGDCATSKHAEQVEACEGFID